MKIFALTNYSQTQTQNYRKQNTSFGSFKMADGASEEAVKAFFKKLEGLTVQIFPHPKDSNIHLTGLERPFCKKKDKQPNQVALDLLQTKAKTIDPATFVFEGKNPSDVAAELSVSKGDLEAIRKE